MTQSVVIVAVMVAAGIMLFWRRFAAIEQRLNRLSRLDAKLDALLKHAGVSFNEYDNVPPDVIEALQRGETILAIKRLRQATGVGLKEAKEFVDEVKRRSVAAS
jgi:ribosomal protein L7/L12